MLKLLGLFNKKGFKEYWKEVIHLYDDLYYTSQVKDRSELAIKRPSELGKLSVDFSSIRDGENITVLFIIQSYPRELVIDFRDKIRAQCKPGVRVNFINKMRKHIINWDSAEMASRLRILEKVSKENADTDVNAYNLHKNLSSIGKQSWIEESLTYLSIADRSRGRTLLKTSTLMTVSGVAGEEFDSSLKGIQLYCNRVGIKLERVLFDIPDVLQYFIPFYSLNLTKEQKTSSRIATQVMTDEIVARFNTYTQGTLGVRGISFGMDVFSGFPVLKVVKPKEDTAENWLITAETGGGKSYTIKYILIQLLGAGFNGTIMDIEGFEYIPIANFVSHKSKVVVINMAEGSGNYFDPVEIPKPTGIKDIDKDAKTLSINFTIAIFKTLLGRAYYEDTWFDTVINDAVSETYLEAGVKEDPSTWKNSEGLELFDVYRKLKQLKTQEYRKDKGYLSALEKAIAILSKYFEEDGTRSSIFKSKVNVEDIIDADLVICSFGMASKSQQAVDETQLNLMQIGAAQISHQRSIFSKSQGKFNFKIWEEFQRWGKFPDSDKTLGVAVTGGRKMGDVNIIITNSVGQILKEDRFDILQNITSFLVGAISDESVRHTLLTRLSVPHLIPELDAISKAKKDDNENSTGIGKTHPLTYSFLCGLDRSKFTIIKTKLPQEFKESKLFKTGVDLNG